MMQSLLSTVFISVVPIFFIYGLNLLFMASPWLKESLLYYLISFAIGGLLGDVFFHTIPHMSKGHDHSHGSASGHSHSSEDLANNAIVVAGILAFFLIEKITKSILGVDNSHDHSSHSHISQELTQDAKQKKQDKSENNTR